MYYTLTTLNVNKATGLDTIGLEFLKHCAISLLQSIHYFNLSNSTIPSERKVHHITPVIKLGDRSLVQNYRSIPLSVIIIILIIISFTS